MSLPTLQLTKMDIKNHIINTLGERTDDGVVTSPNPRDYPGLLCDRIEAYRLLPVDDKIEILNLLAGLIGKHDSIPVRRKEVPGAEGGKSRIICTRSKKGSEETSLRKRGRKKRSYGCSFSCSLNSVSGHLSFTEHCRDCLNDKVDTQERDDVQLQLISPTKV